MGVTIDEASGFLRWCIDCRTYWMDYVSDPEAGEYEPHDCEGETAATAGEGN